VLASNPAEPGVFYAISNLGLYRSADAGRNWERIDIPWPEYYRFHHMEALAVVPAGIAGEGEFTDLLNGTDLSGWRYPGRKGEAMDGKTQTPDGRIEVKDGAIICKPGRGGPIHTTEELGDFELASERRTVAIGRVLELIASLRILAIPYDQSERHVGCDHLPGGARIQQRALQPQQLLGPEKIAVRAVGGLQVRAIGAAIATLIQHEDVEMRPIAEGTINPARLDDAFAQRIHVVDRAGRAGDR